MVGAALLSSCYHYDVSGVEGLRHVSRGRSEAEFRCCGPRRCVMQIRDSRPPRGRPKAEKAKACVFHQ